MDKPARTYAVYSRFEEEVFYKGPDWEKAFRVAKESSNGKLKEVLLGSYWPMEGGGMRIEIKRYDGCNTAPFQLADLSKIDLETITEMLSQKV